MKFKIHFSILFIILSSIRIKAQEKELLSFEEYLELVRNKNLGYASQQYNVSIAEAAIQSARMFPDPQLEIETVNNGIRKDMGYVYGTSLNWTLELGGKRKARINLAKNQFELSKLQLQDYFRNLLADATLAYIETLKSKALLEVQQDSYKNMNQLAKSDSIHYRLGTISLVTSKQSKLEATALLNEVYQAESVREQSLTRLCVFVGDDKVTGRDICGNFNAFERYFNIDDLVLHALNKRTDLLVALQNTQVAQSQIRLEKANRVLDLDVNAGTEYHTEATNKIAPSQTVNAIKWVSVSLLSFLIKEIAI